TIYKLELDDSGYIRGVESMTTSTQKFTERQKQANDILQTNQIALKQTSEYVLKTKGDLDSYTGTNEKYRQQLLRTFQIAQTEQQKLTDLVVKNQKAYEEATKAAQTFAETSQRANNLQAIPGGKITSPGNPNAATPVISQLVPVVSPQLQQAFSSVGI